MLLKDSSVGLDFTRIVACFMVVVLHVSATSIMVFDDNWKYSNAFDSLVRSCVPLFLMISGALLVRKEQPALEFYKKRFIRIFPPLLFWSVFYAAWKGHMGIGYGSVIDSIIAALKGPVYFHLWYLYAIVGIYVAIPFIAKIYAKCSDTEKKSYILIWLLIAGLMPLLSYFIPELSGLDSVYTLQWFSGLIGYVFVGAYAFERVLRQDVNISIPVNCAAFLASSIATAILTYVLSLSEGTPNQLFYSYLSPLVFISAFSAFNILVAAGSHLNKYAKPISMLSGCTLGIYCVHIFVMNRFSLVYGPIIDGESMGWVIPALSLSVFVISFLPIYLMRLYKPARNFI
ncbi:MULTISPECIES: acyltransferase [unclassified Pseudomonas]|uniref:acyltransferase n=1 Tax=unclassified Pseudomonas TaxID=196821 RepID=UPI000F582A8D|nr:MULTISPECIES: acyltransferase family protein [unclassified Pseudomonas]AZF49217.1 hypothetical protein C4J86_4009 [Pseudomonas sp. R2-7-07]AZF59704.1 hypothetical protein C4J84_3854 [Pseudomonas sp. R11-23-07]